MRLLNDFLTQAGAAVCITGALLFAGAAPAYAAADACEKIENADAYNKCLAASGPMRGVRAKRSAVGGDPEKSVPAYAGRGGRMSRRAGPSRQPASAFIQRKANGRLSASFDIAPTTGQAKRQ
ncbi:MAG: hypothetical protein ACRCTD_12975 [Beijerinckiaceae bacterium]